MLTIMSGYSGTPLIKKLGIKENDRAIFINEPENLFINLGKLPNDVNLEKELEGEFDYVHLFTKEKSELEKFFKNVQEHLRPNGMIWISWPKQSSKITTDINENTVREIGLISGLVDVKVAAIDEIWSGLKFVYRLKDR